MSEGQSDLPGSHIGQHSTFISYSTLLQVGTQSTMFMMRRRLALLIDDWIYKYRGTSAEDNFAWNLEKRLVTLKKKRPKTQTTPQCLIIKHLEYGQ